MFYTAIAPPRELSLAVVGIDYANRDGGNRRFEAIVCVPGEPVTLVREPKNKHDPRAVAVFSCRDVQLGYLTAERAPWIGGRIADGEPMQAVFQGVYGAAAWIRVRFGEEAPTLPESDPAPPRRAQREPEYDPNYDPRRMATSTPDGRTSGSLAGQPRRRIRRVPQPEGTRGH